MHTWVPDARSPTLAAHSRRSSDLAETVHTAIMAVSKGSEGLLQWSAIIVSRHLRHLGLSGGTYLRDYLTAAERTGAGLGRWAAFAELCEFFQVSTTASVH